MLKTKEQFDLVTGKIIGCAIEVHKELGPGLMESVYDVCLAEELIRNGLAIKRQVVLPVEYKGRTLEKDFIIDLLVEEEIVVELKSVEIILPVHEAQLVTYLKLSGKKLGLLINFNVPILKDGIKRRINGNFPSV
ncbi:MAG: GxxExxY protein [Chitinophagaceae bacterium]|jgi:GxxExxY protein